MFSVNCYWDQITIRSGKVQSEVVEAWLTELFSPRISSNEQEMYILLADDITRVPIVFDEFDNEDTIASPLIRPSITSSATVYRKYTKPSLEELSLKVNTIAFHSFKGGVGRTLHAIALSKAIADKGKKVLLIDGDFEAPGITYLVRESLTIDYSYADLLGSVHADPTEAQSQSISFAVKSLANQKIGNIYMLPSFRTDYQQRNFEIKPEHIIQNFENPFILPEVLSKIAEGLEIDYIIIDLRAGLSELSTGVLLDPRIEKYLVTSVNAQSLEGTKVLLDVVKSFSEVINYNLPELKIILNNISEVYYTNKDLLDDIKNDLTNRYFGDINDGDEDRLYVIDFIESIFNPDLLALSNNFDEYFSRLAKAGMDTRFNFEVVEDLPDISVNELTNKRTELRDRTEGLIFAERGTADNILWTQPLKRLAESFSTKLPSVVVSGAKGAGKTLIFTNLLKAKYWKSFLEKGGFQSSIDAILLPVLKSTTLSGIALSDLEVLKRQISERLSINSDAGDASAYIESMLRTEHTSAEWTEIWINAIAIASGFHISGDESDSIGQQFLQHLRNHNLKVISLFDGIEDLFQNIGSDSNTNQKDALRALIQRVPDYLAQQPNSPLGIIILIRQDYIEYSIIQNSAQFFDRYKMFQLKWNVDEALKLVWHVSRNVLPAPEIGIDQHAHREHLITALLPLWGLKLGGPASKEARSANWILTALSDWNGQIQARDLIRFLHAAAKGSVHQTISEDRILAVNAIKASVEECSTSKINETGQENLLLNAIFNNLVRLSDKKTPFVPSELQLSPDEIKTLVDNGIIFKEIQKKAAAEQYHIAEIYRHGLGFTYKGRKMTKMLAFRRAIES